MLLELFYLIDSTYYYTELKQKLNTSKQASEPERKKENNT